MAVEVPMVSQRRKVNEEEARVLVREWRASGKAMPAWCAARGIDGRSLRFWAGRLDAQPELRVVEFAPPPRQARPSSRITLRLAGVSILVDEDVSEAALTQVLRAVRAC